MAKGNQSGGPRPGTPAGNNKSNQGNPTSPTYYSGRGQAVPPNLPSGAAPTAPAPTGK